MTSVKQLYHTDPRPQILDHMLAIIDLELAWDPDMNVQDFCKTSCHYLSIDGTDLYTQWELNNSNY